MKNQADANPSHKPKTGTKEEQAAKGTKALTRDDTIANTEIREAEANQANKEKNQGNKCADFDEWSVSWP